jgi:hypothetical protein
MRGVFWTWQQHVFQMRGWIFDGRWRVRAQLREDLDRVPTEKSVHQHCSSLFEALSDMLLKSKLLLILRSKILKSNP